MAQGSPSPGIPAWVCGSPDCPSSPSPALLNPHITGLIMSRAGQRKVTPFYGRFCKVICNENWHFLQFPVKGKGVPAPGQAARWLHPLSCRLPAPPLPPHWLAGCLPVTSNPLWVIMLALNRGNIKEGRSLPFFFFFPTLSKCFWEKGKNGNGI